MNSRFGNPRTLIATATYNERDNIDPLLQSIFELDGEFEALVIDDASPDGTGAHLEHLAGTEARLHVVRRPSKLGLGSAHQLAFMYAIHRGYDRLVTMDADLSHDPDDIPRLLDALEGADMVVGSRYAKGGGSDYHGYRKFLSVSANTLAHYLLRIPLHEFTTSFRAFDVAMLHHHRRASPRSTGYSFFMETVFRLHGAGFRITEVPIYFKDRSEGESKLPKFEIVKGVATLFRLAASRATGRKVFKAAEEVNGKCPRCTSPYLIETSPAQGERSGIGENVVARGSSKMAHKSNQQIIQCLECGATNVRILEGTP